MAAKDNDTSGESAQAPVSDAVAVEAMARSLRAGNDDARSTLEHMGAEQRKAVTDAFQRLYGEPFTL